MDQGITETIGVDLGDKYSHYCVVDHASGEEIESGRIRTTPAAFERFFATRRTARTVMEVGTHSPWASRIVASSCARDLRGQRPRAAVHLQEHSQVRRVDARALARVGRLDPDSALPIRHRGEEAQRDLVLIRARQPW